MELGRDLLVGMTLRNQLEDSDFTWSQGSVHGMLGDFGSDFRTQPLSTPMNSPDRVQQFFSQQAFQEIPLCARLECALHLGITGVRRQYNDASFGKLAANRVDRVDTAHIWHLQIHERDIGVVISELLDGFAPVARLRDQLHIRLGPNQPDNAVTDNRVIVRRKYSNHVLTPPFQRNNRIRERPCRLEYAIEPGTLNSISAPVSGPLRITSFEPI